MAIELTSEQANSRHIPKGDFNPCAEAFIDRRNPNSEGKMNYSFIGPGVTASAAQQVNIAEAHGFNVGGVSLPPNRQNNLHLHFTAEVFVSAAGAWEFFWGNEGESSASFDRRDVFTIPTWIFRGFFNRGGADGFMFAVIGGDKNGGIIWNPKVLAEARDAGMRLDSEGRVIDETRGESLAEGASYIEPLSDGQMRLLPEFTPEQMARFIVRWDELRWRDDGLPLGGSLAPAVGFGMSAARHQDPPLAHPHSFSLEWLKLGAGERTGKWTTGKRQVLIVFDGSPKIALNGSDNEIPVQLEPSSIYSVPPDALRGLVNDGTEEAVALLVNGGDERLLPLWEQAVLDEMASRGLCLDADGFLAPAAAVDAA